MAKPEAATARTRIAERWEVGPGQGKVLRVQGTTLALFNRDGRFYAIDNTCRHRGGPLGEGELEGTVVMCPWHGWCYDITTGVHVDDPSIRVNVYPVTMEGEGLFVDL